MTYDKSKILQDMSDEYLQDSQQPKQSGIMPNQETPISQRSFAMPTKNTEMPKVDVQPTYVPGLGVLGADIGGVVKGLEARQAYRLNEEGNIRANEQLGMAKEELGQKADYLKIAQADLGIKLDKASMERKSYDDEAAIQHGMVQAAQQGGYNNVIEYLKTADPAKALLFHSAKLKLDSDIMGNEVLQAQLPVQKEQALLDTYKVAGKFAAGILGAPAELQADMYKQSQPMLNKFIPGMSTEYDDKAKATLTLMMAQGSPDNIAYANKKLNTYANTAIGKLSLAKKQADKEYGPNSEESKQIQLQMDGLSARANNSIIGQTNAQLMTLNKEKDLQKKNFNMNTTYLSNINHQSTPFITDVKTYGNAYNISHNILSNLKEGKNTAQQQALLQQSWAGMANMGRPSDKDYENVQAATGWNKVSKQLDSFFSGRKVTMQPWEVQQVAYITQYMIDKSYKKQLALEGQFKQNASQWVEKDEQGNQKPIIQWDKMVLPSKTFESMVSETGQQNQQSQQQPSYTKEQIDAFAKDAVQNQGWSTQDAERKKQEFYQQNGIK